MGRTLPTVTNIFLQEQESFLASAAPLRQSDQAILEDLFGAARQHLAAVTYAAHALPFETILLAMLLEEHKEVMRLSRGLEALAANMDE